MSDHLLAHWTDGRVSVRESAARGRWVIDGLVTADHHRARCIFACSVRALAADAERQMLYETFGANGDSQLTIARVVDHFAQAFRTAARRVAEGQTVEWLLEPANQQVLVQALVEAGRKTGFTCGIELLAPFEISIESESLTQDRQLHLQRAWTQQHSARQLEQLQQAGELLARFDTLRREVPGVSVESILSKIAPADQGAMLQSLLMADASDAQTQMLHVACGSELLRIDTRVKPIKIDRLPIDVSAGPLRSVQKSDGLLLVGARNGLVQMSANGMSQFYAVESTSALGFNNAFRDGVRIVGSHSELGIVIWEETAKPARTISLQALREVAQVASEGPRFCTPLSGGVYLLAMGHALLLIDDESLSAVELSDRSPIVGIVADDQRLTVVREDGGIAIVDCATRQLQPLPLRTARAVGATALPWIGGHRLLVGHSDGSLDCIGLNDRLVTRYQTPYQPPRMIAATTDQIAVASADRQRLAILSTWNNDATPEEIYITSLTRHRIVDIEYI